MPREARSESVGPVTSARGARAERVGPDHLRLTTTAGSEFCSPLLDTRVWDSKGQGYRRQQVLKPCACQQARFLERNAWRTGIQGDADRISTARNLVYDLFR